MAHDRSGRDGGEHARRDIAVDEDGIGDAGARRSLVVVARAPRLGTVKTRLARAIGHAAALAVHRELGSRVAEALFGVERCEHVVLFTPADAEAEMREWLGASWLFEPQVEGDLGARMAAALSQRAAAGVERVVMVGTDCPEVDAATVGDAFALLDHADVVFGPALDGGYYLVAARTSAVRDPGALFAKVPWSAPDTLTVNLQRATELRLSVALLPVRRDVDTADDLAAWRQRERAAESSSSW